jgi:hypothetical protein
MNFSKHDAIFSETNAGINIRKTLWYQSEAHYGHVKVQDNLVYLIPITIRPNKMFNIIWHQLFIFLIKNITISYSKFKHTYIYMYSQTCIKRSPLGQRKSGLLRQVTSWKRFNSYEIFYDRTRQRWPLIKVTA